MNKQIWLAGAVLSAASGFFASSAQAHDRTQWSVTVGSQPRGVVMVPQTQYIYGAPPSVYVGPPPVYGPPAVVYVQPQPYVYVNPPPQAYPYPQRQWHGDHHRRHEWHGRRDGQWGYGDRHGHYRR